MFTSGPPLFPGLIAASVCRKLWKALLAPPGSVSRPFALMIPCVTVNVRFSPSGLPTASTHSPTRDASLSPNGAGVSPVASIFSTATSVAGSVPTTRAGNSRRSSSRTVTCVALSTT